MNYTGFNPNFQPKRNLPTIQEELTSDHLKTYPRQDINMNSSSASPLKGQIPEQKKSELDEIILIEKERNDVIKRIQERQRMLELLKNDQIKCGINEIEDFQRRNKAKELEKERLKKEQEQRDKEILSQREKDKVDLQYKSFQEGLMQTVFIKRIQRKWREHIVSKNKREIRNSYVAPVSNNFFGGISFEKVTELRKNISKKLKTMKIPSAEGDNYKYLLNNYFNLYRNFCENFPDSTIKRENNFYNFFQCQELLNYIETMKDKQNFENAEKFNKFLLDRNREYSAKIKVDKLEKAYLSKNMWYHYTEFDDFEENNLLDTIDEMYGFESREKILNKK